MTPEPKDQAVPVVGVEEAVERLEFSAENPSRLSPIGKVLCTVHQDDLRTVLKALSQPYREEGLAHSPAAHTHRATEQPVVGWQPIESLPERAGYYDLRTVTTYRWLPYKVPQGGKKGRWQSATEYGWKNDTLPYGGEWRPNLPVGKATTANSVGTQSRSDEVNHLQAQLKAASPTPAPDTGEAVAWRWRVDGMRGWNVSPTRYVRIAGAEVQPLYASNNMEEVERLRKALAWYADRKNYIGNPTPNDRPVLFDAGLRASQALGGKRDV